MPDPVAAGANLFAGNDDKTKPVYASDYLNALYNNLAQAYRPKYLNAAVGDYKTALDSLYPQSAANDAANYYSQYTKNIIGDPNTYLSDYEKLRAGNLSSLGNVFKDVLDYGLQSEKARLAAGGYGNTGPSSYDRILSSTRTASNLTPVLNTIYGNLGREATASYGSREDRNRYLLDLFASDPFGRYATTGATRAMEPYLQRLALTNAALQGAGLAGQNVRANIQGYETIPGLTTRLSAIGKDINSALTGGLYGQSFGSQPGQDTATTMGLIGTAASIYGGNNQYRPPQLASTPNTYGMGGSGWQGAYTNYNPATSYVNQNPTGGFSNYTVSYAPPSGAQDYYYQQQAGGLGGITGGLGGMGFF